MHDPQTTNGNRRRFLAGATAGAVGAGGIAATRLLDPPVAQAASIDGYFNVKDYAATGDGTTDDTQAIKDAIAAMPTGGGVLYFPPGTYLITPETAGGALQLGAGDVLLGAGRDACTIKSKLPGDSTSYRMVSGGGGRIEIRNITIAGPDGMTSGKSVSGLYTRDEADTLLHSSNVAFLGLNIGARGFDSTTHNHTLEFHDCLFDGMDIGSASGAGADFSTGILVAGANPTFVVRCRFKRLGSDTASGSNHSHAIYASEDSPVAVLDSHFEDHIDGRYIQFHGSSASPASENFAHIRGCYFGPYQVGNRAVHTSTAVITLIEGCDFAADGSKAEIDVKGPCTIRDCIFRGNNAGTFYAIEIDETSVDGDKVSISGCRFDGNRSRHVDVAADNVVLNITDCDFFGITSDSMELRGTGHDVRVRGCHFSIPAGNDGIDVESGSHARLRIDDSEFNGGDNGIDIKSGATVSKLYLRDNEFVSQSGAAVAKAGSVTAESSLGNIGYADV